MTTSTLNTRLGGKTRTALSADHYIDFEPFATVADVIAEPLLGSIQAQTAEMSDDHSAMLSEVAAQLGLDYSDLGAAFDDLSERIHNAVLATTKAWREENGAD